MSNHDNLSPKNPYIGYVVGGSLKDNLRVRLTSRRSRCRKAALWSSKAATGSSTGW
jgi:hypothetical protein